MNCIVDCIEVSGFCTFCKVEFTCCSAVLCIYTHLKVFLCAVCNNFAEKFSKFRSVQVVAVNASSDIYKLSDLEGKNLAVQSTTKPEGIFLNRTDERIPKLGNLISLGHRELIYTFLGKGYVDAVAAHEESIVQYKKDYDTDFRVLEEPLMVVGIGVAFAKADDRGICEQMNQTLEEMRRDGTSLKIIGKYLDDPEKYLEVDDLGD